MKDPENKPYRLASHQQARIDTAFTKPGGVAVSSQDMECPEDNNAGGRDARVARIFWVAYFCLVLPFVIWAVLTIARYMPS